MFARPFERKIITIKKHFEEKIITIDFYCCKDMTFPNLPKKKTIHKAYQS